MIQNMTKNICLSITVMVLTGVVFFGTAATALAAKGVIQGIGTGGAGSIVVSDLGITDVGTLPTSTWYFLKEWRRGLERLFTFGSVKKAELELHITNEKAAEVLTIQEEEPDDVETLAKAMGNYADATERLEARLAKLTDTSENPNVAALLEKLNEQTLKHAVLFNQLAERYIGDPDFDLVTNTVKDAQEKIENTINAASEKEKNIKEKAAEQIERAEASVKELESELAEFAINEPGVPNEKTGPIRIDSPDTEVPPS